MKKNKQCKKCGSTQYFVKGRASGKTIYYYNSNGTQEDNSGLNDYLVYTKQKKAYCTECGAYFGKV